MWLFHKGESLHAFKMKPMCVSQCHHDPFLLRQQGIPQNEGIPPKVIAIHAAPRDTVNICVIGLLIRLPSVVFLQQGSTFKEEPSLPSLDPFGLGEGTMTLSPLLKKKVCDPGSERALGLLATVIDSKWHQLGQSDKYLRPWLKLLVERCCTTWVVWLSLDHLASSFPQEEGATW